MPRERSERLVEGKRGPEEREKNAAERSECGLGKNWEKWGGMGCDGVGWDILVRRP